MGIAFKVAEDLADGGNRVDDVVGRFRSGFQSSSGRPVSLDAFRLTTGDPDVAAAIAGIMGSDDTGISEWDTVTEEKLQVFTETSEVDIIVEPGSIKATLVLWSQRGKKIVETDGTCLIVDGVLTSEPWEGASKSLKQLKEDASNGIGPGPSLQCYFRLANHPELGKLKYFSGSWTAIADFNRAELRVEAIGGPASATLGLERVEFTTNAGKDVSYVKPSLRVFEKFEGATE